MNSTNESRTWAMILHLSVFAGYLVPIAGWVAPIVIWQVKKSELPEIDEHGRNVINWMVTSIIYAVACFLLSFVVIGVPLMFVLAALGVAFPIIGAVKASSGIVWKYPLSIRFF